MSLVEALANVVVGYSPVVEAIFMVVSITWSFLLRHAFKVMAGRRSLR